MLRHLLILAGCAALPAIAEEPKFDAATAANQLGLDLFRQLIKSASGGNLVISPYSIDSALALVYSGADGTTRSEMVTALHFPAENASLQASFSALRTALEGSSRVSAEVTAGIEDGNAVEWHQANRLFGQQGYAFRSSFLSLMQDGYGAPFEPLDFRAAPESARQRINTWIDAETRGKIPALISDASMISGARLVLVNALYLKAPWLHPFEKTLTESAAFYLRGSDPVDVPTMNETEQLGYVSEERATVVSVDYFGGLQFLILLPKKGTTCDELAAELTPKRLKSWSILGQHKTLRRVELHLPKFRVEGSSLRLGSPLRSLGIKHAFDEPPGSADFDRIAPRLPNDYLSLSEVIHQTFIAVDENGTEASAATAAMMATLGIMANPPSPIVVRVDRPFLFVIQHRASAACLFLGKIDDPR